MPGVSSKPGLPIDDYRLRPDLVRRLGRISTVSSLDLGFGNLTTGTSTSVKIVPDSRRVHVFHADDPGH